MNGPQYCKEALLNSSPTYKDRDSNQICQHLPLENNRPQITASHSGELRDLTTHPQSNDQQQVQFPLFENFEGFAAGQNSSNPTSLGDWNFANMMSYTADHAGQFDKTSSWLFMPTELSQSMQSATFDW